MATRPNVKLQDNIMSTISVLVVAVLASFSAVSRASPHYQTYEAIAQRLDDGNKVTAEKVYIKLNSDEPALLADKTITNSIGGNAPGGRDKTWASRVRPDRVKQRAKHLHKHNLVGGTDYESNSLNSIGGHQLFARMRPRTVESPALSVDTGRSRSSSPSDRLANGIKRLFNVEEGHYTDIYERIDKHKPLKKRKPAEAIDDRLGFGRGH